MFGSRFYTENILPKVIVFSGIVPTKQKTCSHNNCETIRLATQVARSFYVAKNRAREVGEHPKFTDAKMLQ